MSPANQNSPPSKFGNSTIHVTGHGDDGLAKLHSSKPGEWQYFPQRNVGYCVPYTTSSFPVDMNNDADIASNEEVVSSGKLGLVRPGGTVCRIVDFGPNEKPMMHRTQSLDYGIVLEGEIIMELDDGSSTLMKKGDIAVQRGTNHAWRNPSKTEWARMFFVLQDSKPVLVGGKKLKEELGQGSNIPKSGNDG